jgi:hypothetical protein
MPRYKKENSQSMRILFLPYKIGVSLSDQSKLCSRLEACSLSVQDTPSAHLLNNLVRQIHCQQVNYY